jgi:glycosyltransferase involved in cell wall biosynthesis|tara:strand:- start:7 stop:768 length:762 start_codon:yes stop_codon:yes gene_type:complete
MISYIIPTLWKSPNIFKLIESFKTIKDENAELIVINNAVKENNYKPNDSRIKVAQMGSNQFVNPSWQLGVDYSSQDRIAIVNDDIIFDVKRFHEFILASNAKAVCMTNWNRIDKDKNEWALVSNNSPNARPAGGGQLMMVMRENWPTLPYKMKLWHGDDVIYYYNTLIKNIDFCFIRGMAVTGDQSVSVNSNVIPKKMGETFTKDTLEYYKKMHILGLSCSTVFPMELKMAWKHEDVDGKLLYEQKLDKIING